MKKSMRTGLIILFLIVFAVSGIMVAKKVSEYRQGEAIYKEADELTGIENVEIPIIIPIDKNNGELAEPVIPADILASLEELDIAGLREKNKDVFGWILIPGADISYPLLDGDDNTYYLTHTWDKKWNHMGSIFLEQECKADFSDFNTIIYGHNMRNTTMFSNLKKYLKEGFWEDAPHVYIITEKDVMRYDIFSAGELSVKSHAFWLYVEDDGLKKKFIDKAIETSEIETDIRPEADDKILTLSTCTGNGHEKRMVVQAILAKGE